MKHEQKVCLTIAGLDPSGGAGIVADLKTFAAFGCYGAAAVSSITFQNTVQVAGFESQSAKTIRGQLDPIFDDMTVDAAKTGMLPTADAIAVTAAILRERKFERLVVDPVARSTSGFDLIDDDAVKIMIDELFPLALVITPNIAEAERLTEMQIASDEDVEKAGRLMLGMGAKAVLIKGGHLSREKMTDRLFTLSGVEVFEGEKIDSRATHGTGCTLSAAIAACIAKGSGLSAAIRIAKDFVTEGIRTSPMIGRGFPSLNHLLDGERMFTERE
jgi:hydroxymethylpyrimidine kinase/phosphomethylpyrimidine kinase